MSDNTAMVLIFAVLGMVFLLGLLVISRAYVESQRIRHGQDPQALPGKGLRP